MPILIVHLHVKPERLEEFLDLALDNASHSREEPGVARFELLRQRGDEHRFVLFEVYRTPEDVAVHKDTAHYARWKSRVAELLAEPRTSALFDPVAPAGEDW
jgi:(4S)-4-hydroxy-5-phosphonooxypentane-2,3-dione isomerase